MDSDCSPHAAQKFQRNKQAGGGGGGDIHPRNYVLKLKDHVSNKKLCCIGVSTTLAECENAQFPCRLMSKVRPDGDP